MDLGALKPSPYSGPSIIGIAVAITGNIIISFALNCQKLAHKRLEEQRSGRTTPRDEELGGRADYGSTTTTTVRFADSVQMPSRNRFRGEDERNSQDPAFFIQPQGPPNPTTGAVHFEARPISTSSLPRTKGKTRSSILPARSSRLSITSPAPSPIPEESSNPTTPLHSPGRTDDGQSISVGSPTIEAPWIRSPPKKPLNGIHLHDTPDKKPDNNGHETEYLQSKLWWIGFMLLNVGELGNFLSYGFAPASVVAPLGTFALIANCVFAPIMLKEKFHQRDLIGVAISIVGVITVVGAGKAKDVRLDPNGLLHAIIRLPFIIYASICCIFAAILSYMSDAPAGQRFVFVDVGLCALFGGFTVLSTKGVSMLLSLEWLQIFKEWITYPLLLVLLGTGVGQIRYLNRALMKFDSKVVIPTQFVLFNLSAIVGSAVLYRDFDNMTVDRFVVFLYGCATTFVGVFLLTRPVRLGSSSEESTPEPSPPPSPGATHPSVGTPLLSPRTTRASDSQSLRGRSSTTSLAMSPAYLLLASGSPKALSGPLVAVPVKQRTRSESRSRPAHFAIGGEPGSVEERLLVGPSSVG